MLVDFRFKNFRSFKDETVFSMVASNDKEHLANNTVETGNSSVPRILKVTCTYGANASGKSNLVKAIQTMQGIVAKSAIVEPNMPLPAQPFRLSTAKAEEPTEFEITFFCDDTRYQFGFRFTAKQILSEWLIAYKTSKPQSWYSRNYNPKNDDYEYKFGPHLLGAKTLWRDATRENSLFLSTAIQLNSEQLKPVFDWITESLVVFNNRDGPMFGNIGSTVEHIKREGADHVRRFLSAADIVIDNIELKSFPVQSFQIDAVTGQLSNAREDLMLPVFSHSTESGSASFELSEESHGTQRLFALAGPLIEILNNSRVLIVDELDKSLHPLLARHLIGQFQTFSESKTQAQLIFTAHDTSILTPELLRRDQIWFAEKDRTQSSTLTPLTDFAPRKHEAFERGYLAGRYGAVPILREWAR